jgi:hypothetical protein
VPPPLDAPLPAAVAVVPFPAAVPPQPFENAQTGAFAVTGAAAAADGETVVPLAWTVPIDCPAFCVPPPVDPPLPTAVAVVPFPAAFPPQPFEATHTGAFAVTGAAAAADGETVVPLA